MVMWLKFLRLYAWDVKVKQKIDDGVIDSHEVVSLPKQKEDKNND